MKVITIGRDLDNDIVVHDSKVSRHHLQIINEAGSFRIVDLYSTNGTFVNDKKISGETSLLINDIVRVGNSVLPWQTYFAKKETKSRILQYVGIAGVIMVIAIIAFFLIYDSKTQETRIKMQEENGVLYIPMKVNGQELNFVFDTGASSICISTLEAMILIKNGLLLENDILGQEGFMDATGRISVGTKINLRTIQIGDRKLSNVEATVIENPRAECLLGQTALSQFGTYKIDNSTKEVIFE
ncbi:FHA domain-containing protein [Bacteroidales bacterium OttesenSCG-928-M06]|nr:FHA domain-containing protein [Bacteroidales bacterium OttesenSCG-928-M06]